MTPKWLASKVDRMAAADALAVLFVDNLNSMGFFFLFLVSFGIGVRMKAGGKNRLPRDLHGCQS
jgi:hypothetical protein